MWHLTSSVRLTSPESSALFWQHEADGSRILTLAQSGGRYRKLAAISRAPVKGWVIQAASGQLIGCKRYRKSAMLAGEEWALGSLQVEHLKEARERGIPDEPKPDSAGKQGGDNPPGVPDSQSPGKQ